VSPIVASPHQSDLDGPTNSVLLYSHGASFGLASSGALIARTLGRRSLDPDPVAVDFMSVALAVVTVDHLVTREASPDGWTREIDLEVAVSDVERWRAVAGDLERALWFLTTDRWRIGFRAGGYTFTKRPKPKYFRSRSVTMLSGGLDSLVGAIDLSADAPPIAVSVTVRGDGEKQKEFAGLIGGGLEWLQLNHNVYVPGSAETSQRSRSLVFIASSILAATSTLAYHAGAVVPVRLCENGVIAVNAPLTPARIGSLSTRTAHPEFIERMSSIFSRVGIRVELTNPYALKTKGEMLQECRDQDLLTRTAFESTSCGRFQRYNYRHCGRCVPCQIRRAAILAWGQVDTTDYVFQDLGRRDSDHSASDDVRSVAMALEQASGRGFDQWLGASLSFPSIGDLSGMRDMIRRGVEELRLLHQNYGVV
jgi:hypothetical protein